MTWLEPFAFGGGAAALSFIKKAVMLSTSIEIMGIGAQADAGATTGFASGEGLKASSILEDQDCNEDCNDPGEEKEALSIPCK